MKSRRAFTKDHISVTEATAGEILLLWFPLQLEDTLRLLIALEGACQLPQTDFSPKPSALSLYDVVAAPDANPPVVAWYGTTHGSRR